MADYELVAGTVWQFAMSVSCQRNFAYKVLKHPPHRVHILTGPAAVPVIQKDTKKDGGGSFQKRTSYNK